MNNKIILSLALFVLCSASIMGQTFTQSPVEGQPHLRLLHLSHYDRYGNVQVGELICNKAIANDLIEIFRELYNAQYRIERMETVDKYDGDDERSMTANNTSCYNYRPKTGNKSELSMHARGLAIDINPLYNPYIHHRTGRIAPLAGKPYVTNRDKVKEPWPGAFIKKDDLIYKLFIKHGFTWGGNWRSCKDYQHFEKKVQK